MCQYIWKVSVAAAADHHSRIRVFLADAYPAIDQHQCFASILPIGMTVAWKSDPIGCKGSDPDVNQTNALHIKVGSTDFPRC